MIPHLGCITAHSIWNVTDADGLAYFVLLGSKSRKSRDKRGRRCRETARRTRNEPWTFASPKGRSNLQFVDMLPSALAIMDEQPTEMPAFSWPAGQHEICLGTQPPYDVVRGMEPWRRINDDKKSTTYLYSIARYVTQ